MLPTPQAKHQQQQHHHQQYNRQRIDTPTTRPEEPLAVAGSGGGGGGGGGSLPLEKYNFYLDIKNAALGASLRDTIIRLGGRVEVFLVEAVTHVVTSNNTTSGTGTNIESTTNTGTSAATASQSHCQKLSHKRRISNCRSRVDAMLECVEKIPQVPTLSIVQQAKNLNIPVWSVQKIEAFLNKASALLTCKRVNGEKTLKGAFIKFEALDRKKRAIFQEFPAWPHINLKGEHSSCPFKPFELKSSFRGTLSNNKKKAGSSARPKQTGKYTSKNKLRMKRRSRRRSGEESSVSLKQKGFCEICRVDYDSLKKHEQSLKHISFVENPKNFSSLDKVISTTDSSALLKNKQTKTSNNNLEKKPQRNSKCSEESETVCNGNSEIRNDNLQSNKQSIANLVKTHPQMSPALSDRGHYLRSKGVNTADQDYQRLSVSPKDAYKKDIPNGVVNSKLANDKYEMSTKVNGHTDENKQSYFRKSRKPRSIRWRRPSPDSAPPIQDNQTFYKVVGMSTKLRSSNSFIPNSPKESEPNNITSKPLYNGDSNSGLVVKFRRVRRSELSVLSDEAESFMFPKKDDSDTEDEVITSSSSCRAPSSELLTSNDLKSKVKEEVFSGDDVSQDSCGSETKRKTRRRTQSDRDGADVEVFTKPPKLSKSPDTTSTTESSVGTVQYSRNLSNGDDMSPEKCLRWENGSLKASPEVENLTYTFEKIPLAESWYDAFKRQDEGKENPKSISQYLGCYLKAPILPYEMSQLPPLKPNCCILSQMKKPNYKCVPSRLYGTRGMISKKLMIDAASSSSSTSSSSRNPRKSPREHASTLAILGSLIQRKRNKTSGSEDSKSLPSILEEDTSSDANLTSKSSEIINNIDPIKKIDELFSTIYDDIEDYDISIEHIEQTVKIDKSSLKPNVVDLLHSFESCDVLEKTVMEMQDDMEATNEGKRKRGRYKMKKKNKTGWPKKKRIKKESSSAVESRSSSREPSPDLEVLPRRGRRRKTKFNKVLKLNASDKKLSDQDVSKSPVEINENSINSSDDCLYEKNTSDDEYTAEEEEENYLPSVRYKSRRWRNVGSSASVKHSKYSNRREKRHSSNGLQPVVRVQKMKDPEKVKNLQSATSKRQLRRRWNPNR